LWDGCVNVLLNERIENPKMCQIRCMGCTDRLRRWRCAPAGMVLRKLRRPLREVGLARCDAEIAEAEIHDRLPAMSLRDREGIRARGRWGMPRTGAR
jgi:hypothetical protein